MPDTGNRILTLIPSDQVLKMKQTMQHKNKRKNTISGILLAVSAEMRCRVTGDLRSTEAKIQ